MPSLTRSDRIRGMIWGLFVADASALGSHWIYDLDAMARAFPDGVRGFEPPGAVPYHKGKHSGDFTHYGDGALLLLESLAETGKFDERDFGERFERFFGAAESHSYKDHATKETLAHLKEQPGNFQRGAHDDQPGAVVRVPPLVALYREDEEQLFAAVEKATRVTHDHVFAVACAEVHAELLGHLLRGESFQAALGEVSAELYIAQPDSPRAQLSALLRLAVDRAEEDATAATLAFGQGCPLVKTFPSAIHAAFRHSDSGPDAFEKAVLATLAAGGDNAARACLIGAWFGAAHGLEGVPAEWRAKLTAAPRIESAVEALLTKAATN